MNRQLGLEMLYDLKIAPSLGEVGVSEDFFEKVETDAVTALGSSRLCPEQALALAEYLDCVDSNALALNAAVYARCVAGVSEFLSQTFQTPRAQELANRSPSAKTLLGMTSQSRVTSLVRVKAQNGR